MIYVVTAYRWGCRDKHSYVVGASTNKARAIELAQAEPEYRGGKYGCQIIECSDGVKTDDSVERVAYFPSRYGESCPQSSMIREMQNKGGIVDAGNKACVIERD